MDSKLALVLIMAWSWTFFHFVLGLFVPYSGYSLVRFKSDPLAPFTFRAQGRSDTKHGSNVAHTNHWTLECQQQIYSRVIHVYQQKAEVFLSWPTFVSYLSVFQNVYAERINPQTSHVFTSPYIKAHRFAIQSLIGNSGHTYRFTHVRLQRRCL